MQRVQRGWSDLDRWNMGGYLTQIIAEMARDMRLHHAGHPYRLTDGKWQATLLEIEQAFAVGRRPWEGGGELTEEEWQRMVRGFRLLRQYWFDLWD